MKYNEPRYQTREIMMNELIGYVLNPECNSTDRDHRRVWQLAHPSEVVLPHEVIHHINGNHDDNRIENLVKVDPTTHARLHVQMFRDSQK